VVSLLPKNMKITVFSTIMLSIVVCGCENLWLENLLLRRRFVPKRVERIM
jgi:hypothetical protein